MAVSDHREVKERNQEAVKLLEQQQAINVLRISLAPQSISHKLHAVSEFEKATVLKKEWAPVCFCFFLTVSTPKNCRAGQNSTQIQYSISADSTAVQTGDTAPVKLWSACERQSTSVKKKIATPINTKASVKCHV